LPYNTSNAQLLIEPSRRMDVSRDREQDSIWQSTEITSQFQQCEQVLSSFANGMLMATGVGFDSDLVY
jgi:hypothetical protein